MRQLLNARTLPKVQHPPRHKAISWRQIEAALQDYFGGTCDGDVFVEIEEDDFFELISRCDDCKHGSVELNLTELAKHIADFVGVDA